MRAPYRTRPFVARRAPSPGPATPPAWAWNETKNDLFWVDWLEDQSLPSVYTVGTRGVNVAADSSIKVRFTPCEPGQGACPEFHRSGEVTQILGISRRQLHYWARTGLVRPSHRTLGGHHRYSFQDLVALKTAKRLIDAGVSVQSIRKSISALQRTLPTVRRPLAELVLVATGDVVLVLHDGAAFEAVTGQEWVFEIAQFRRELEAWHSSRDRAGSPAQRVAQAASA